MSKIYLDIETTGIDVNTDRIVQLSYSIKPSMVDNFTKDYFFNPEMPISPGATEVHGITDEAVEDKPTFRELAETILHDLEDKTIVTYNGINFDIPILVREFERCGINFKPNKLIDVYKIESKISPRTLAATYRKYTHMELENAHNAMSDVTATMTILEYQTKMHDLDDEKLLEMSDNHLVVDYFGKFKKNARGEIVFNFGKNLGKRLTEDVPYCQWMLKSDFPQQVKDIIHEQLNKHLV